MSNTIGVITNFREAVFQRDCITGIEDIARQHNSDVLIDSIAEDPAHPKGITIPVHELTGLIVIANAVPDEMLRAWYEQGVHLTLISHRVSGTPIPAIIQSNLDGIGQLVNYLVQKCGCRKFVAIRGNMAQHDGIQRDRKLQQSLLRYNLRIPDEHLLAGEFEPEVAARSVQKLLQHDSDFDAIIAADYLMGVTALNILREHGIHVPEDVCVVGFGDGPEAEAAGLTTVAADVVELGRRAARQLFAQISGMQIQGVTWLNTTLIERETCRKLKTAVG